MPPGGATASPRWTFGSWPAGLLSLGSTAESWRVVTKPSTFTTGTISVRSFARRDATRASAPGSASIVAYSMAASSDGHSRAWCRPIRKNVGRPSAALTLSAISTPWMSRPWNVLPMTTGRTVSGCFSTSAFSSV